MDIIMDREYNSVASSEIDHHNLPSDPLWTVEDVAAYLQLQPETIRSMARRGELRGIKIGKSWRFQNCTIREMLNSAD